MHHVIVKRFVLILTSLLILIVILFGIIQS